MEYRPISDGRPLQRALHHPNPFTDRSLKDRVLFRSEVLCSPEGVNMPTECTIVGHTLHWTRSPAFPIATLAITSKSLAKRATICRISI